MLVAVFLFSHLAWAQQLEDIPAKREPVIDTFYHSYVVEDDYRWMEEVNTGEVKEWVKEQNKRTKKYIRKIPGRSRMSGLIEKYGDVKYVIVNDIPVSFNLNKKYKYDFASGYYNDVSTPALMYRGPGMHDYKVLVDPEDISLTDNILIENVWRSEGEGYIVYLFSRNGSDKKEARIISLADGKQLPDILENIMYSDILWYKDGFFYSRYDKKDEFGVVEGQQVMYHKVGTGQFEDKVIFERKKYPYNRFKAHIIKGDDDYFVLKEEFPQKGKINFFYFDLKTDDFHVKPLIVNLKDDIDVFGYRNGKFIATSKIGTGTGVLIEIDPAHPYHLKAITPAFSKAVLNNFLILSDKRIAAFYLAEHPILAIIDSLGKVLFTLDLPKATSPHFFGLSGNYLIYYYNSYTVPSVYFALDLDNYKKTLLAKSNVRYDFYDIEMKEVEYKSTDGTKVPLTLVYNKNNKMDGSAPALLEAYGGYGVVDPPSFSPAVVYFVMQGGVYAYAHIRGGGEKGKAWAEAGRGEHKQQSFDDFTAAAEYLIDEKYTSPEKLAAHGASNGGLVVAAAAIRRPDLFKVVVPEVAPLDMLRYEKFTVGKRWVKEYGTVKDSLSFLNLLAYSPYQNIKEDVNYPAMLILTADHDDRVPPLNSYKFAARLQNRSAQTNPVFLKVEKQAGHNGALTIKAYNQHLLDLYSFIWYQLNGKEKKD